MHSEYDIDQACFRGSAPIDSSAPPALATPSNGPSPRQPWGRLLKAVHDLADNRAKLVRHVERDWSSATFSGSRHALTLCFAGSDADAGEAFIAALPDHEFTIPRWLVADAQIVAVEDTQVPQRRLVVEVELLLLDRA